MIDIICIIYILYILYIYIELNIRCKSPAFSKLSPNMNGLRLDLRSTLQRFILVGAHSGRYLKYRKVKAMLPQPTMDSQPEDEAFPPLSSVDMETGNSPLFKKGVYGCLWEYHRNKRRIFQKFFHVPNVKVTWIKSQVRIDLCKQVPATGPQILGFTKHILMGHVFGLFSAFLVFVIFQLDNLGLILPESPLVSFAGGCISPSLVDSIPMSKTYVCSTHDVIRTYHLVI